MQNKKITKQSKNVKKAIVANNSEAANVSIGDIIAAVTTPAPANASLHPFVISAPSNPKFSNPLKKSNAIANGVPARPQTLSARQASLLAGLKNAYGKQPFTLRGLDIDIINQAVYRGELAINPADQTAQLTAKSDNLAFERIANAGGLIITMLTQPSAALEAEATAEQHATA